MLLLVTFSTSQCPWSNDYSRPPSSKLSEPRPTTSTSNPPQSAESFLALAPSAESCVSDVGQGWTVGPKSAAAATMSARIFDSFRITSHERSLLHSLIPESLPPLPAGTHAKPQAVVPTFTCQQRRSSHTEPPAPASSSFAGIAIGAYDDNEDENEDVDDYDRESPGTVKVQDFFNIEEASSEDSSSAATEPAASL